MSKIKKERVVIIGLKKSGRKSMICALKKLGYKEEEFLFGQSFKKIDSVLEKFKDKKVLAVNYDYDRDSLNAILEEYPNVKFIITKVEGHKRISSIIKSNKKANINTLMLENITFDTFIKEFFHNITHNILIYDYKLNREYAPICRFLKLKLPKESFIEKI